MELYERKKTGSSGVTACGAVDQPGPAAALRGETGRRNAETAEKSVQAGQKEDSGTDETAQAEGTLEEQERPVLNERETPAGEVEGITIRIYHSDDAAENICVNTAMTEEITPEILIMNLASYGMLPDTVTVKAFLKERRRQRTAL